MNHRISLNGTWNFSFTAPTGELISTTAQVPGNREPVLQQLGLLDDYLPADRIDATEPFDWVDDWCYTTSFSAPLLSAGHRQELVFEGIDSIAEIYLNGAKLGDTENMHLAYRFDVTDRLQPTNELKVVIRSSELWARQFIHDQSAAHVGFPGYYDSSAYLRKARHQYGWDNAPRLLTGGIIRSVYLEQLPPCRLEDVYLYTAKITEKEAVIGAHWVYRTDAKSLRGYTVRLSLLDGERVVFTNEKPIRFTQGASQYQIPMEDVTLWWPAGWGEPFLYTLRLEILANGVVSACHEAPFGIRTVKFDWVEDLNADGTGNFRFIVNGEPIFIRGTNWKPLSPMGAEADAKTASEVELRDLIALHCNMVRIWGGGIYEDHAFYDFCDRHGILVWQDFMLACEVPPTDERACALYAKEAEFILRKLRNHTCLALWCGDNENDKCIYWLHPQGGILPSDMAISRRVLKDAVRRHDPYRSYLPSSPYISDTEFRAMQAGGPTNHLPDIHFYPNAVEFHQKLRELPSLFISEVGPMPVNAIAVNERIFERERPRAERLWDAPVLPTDPPHHFDTLHQDDNYFTVWRNSAKALCMDRYGRDFTLDEFKDCTLAVNLACAEIYKDVVEYCRIHPLKTGVLWWSLWDMFPMLYNYSVIDCDGNRKLPYFWLRQAQQEVALIATRPANGEAMHLYLANDTLKEQAISYTVTAYDAKGNARIAAEGSLTAAKNAVTDLGVLEDHGAELLILRWERGGKVDTNHALTAFSDFDTCREWVAIIARECGMEEEILELQ